MSLLLALSGQYSAKSRLNRANYALARLNREITDNKSQISNLQESMEAAKTATSRLFTTLKGGSDSIWNAQASADQTNITNTTNLYRDALLKSGNDSSNKDVVAAKEKVDEANKQAQEHATQAYYSQQASAAGMAQIENISKTIFDDMEKAQLDQLQDKDASLERRKITLEDESASASAEFKSYQELEKSSIDDAVPHFGQSR